MRITVRQLRALIREAVQEMNPELRPDCDTFAVFDFDETLASSDNYIIAKKPGQKPDRINSTTSSSYGRNRSY